MNKQNNKNGCAIAVVALVGLFILGAMIDGIQHALNEIPFYVAIPISILVIISFIKVFGD